MKKRPRINRWTPSRRDLIFSNSIKKSLVQPHFVVQGESQSELIVTNPPTFKLEEFDDAEDS